MKPFHRRRLGLFGKSDKVEYIQRQLEDMLNFRDVPIEESECQIWKDVYDRDGRIAKINQISYQQLKKIIYGRKRTRRSSSLLKRYGVNEGLH